MLGDSKRLYSFDALKTLAACMVVFQHACGYGFISEYILAIVRIAVPLFMMITGYFYIDTASRGNEKKQIVKFTRIAVEMCLFYFAVAICWNLISGNISAYLKEYLKLSSWVNFLVFNDPIPADLSWYMWAMIYVLLLMYVFPDIYKNKIIRRTLIFVCTAASLILGKYSILFFDREFLTIYTRNAWTIGIPSFLLGVEIKEYSERIRKIERRKLILFVVGFIILNIVERTVLIHCNINASRDIYICTTLLAVAVFDLFLSFSNMTQDNGMVKFGIKYSLALYVIHSFFVKFEVRIFDMNSYQQVFGIIFVFVVSSLSAVFGVNIKDKLIRGLRQTGNYNIRSNRKKTKTDELSPISFERIYQYADGTYLPDPSQPNPEDMYEITTGAYTPHESTRYTNVVIGENGSAQSCGKDCDKELPELYSKREDCCGCTACYAVCPVQAISMRPDEEGFLYPVVDVYKCIRCYKCAGVCPIKAKDNDRNEKQEENETIPTQHK